MKSFESLVDSLIAQRRRCGGDSCRVRGCRRCRRGLRWRARNPHQGAKP
ncbi:hypothetical protein [Mycolicibacterium peregrinum]|nr:hypothetical protein [Mycolicibacterium peregrinum]